MNICDGIDKIIDHHLGITDIGGPPHYVHRTSCLRLCSKPDQLDAPRMISEILIRLKANWDRSPRPHVAEPSLENWRFEKQVHLADRNSSPEKIIEKTIARAGSPDWVNQVPTASGLYNSTSDKHRNIDLVHRLDTKRYEFIELKYGSDTPLQGAIQTLLYGMLYIFSRLHYPDTCLSRHEILRADHVHLCLLSPRSYYDGYNLDWVGRAFTSGLETLIEDRSLNLKMDFQFYAFPERFIWPCDEDNLLAALEEVAPVEWR